MIESERSINRLIHNQLIGNITEEEKKKLKAWLNDSPQNKDMYDRLMQKEDFSHRYRQYAKVDDKEAWNQFRRKHLSIRRFKWGLISRYAALLLLPIVGTFIALRWEKESQPMLSDDVCNVMIRSEQMGKQKATLILPDGEKIDLTSVKNQPLKPQSEKLSPSTTSPAREEKVSEDTVKNNQLLTHSDSEYWVTFEDGTIVHLNYDTTIKYPTHFHPLHRTVYLEGEAYFQVAKESGRPFRVVTSNGVVTEYGTSFSVNTYTAECTKVVLVEGSISVTPKKGEERMMKSGELAVLQSGNPQAEIRKVDIEPYIAWNTGRFVFDNCSLESLMDVISRWYGKKVVFKSDNIRKMYFTGDIDRYSSIEPVLKAIQRVTELEITLDKQNIILEE